MSSGSCRAETSHFAHVPSPVGQYGVGPSSRKKIAGLWFGQYLPTNVVWQPST